MNLAIITGASSGLGREYARAILEAHPQFDQLLLIARRRERLEAIAREYPGREIHLLPLDLTAQESIPAIGQWLEAHEARVGLLINNAGMGTLGDVADSDPDTQAHMVDLNCRALTALTTLCLKYMDRGGAIVNVCSIASFVPNARLNTYSATKAYVLSFTKGLRYELRSRGVNVLAACPGPMETEFLPVAGSAAGASPAFDRLPRVQPRRMARKSLAAALRGKCVYTDGALYKLYRVVAKLLPHNLLLPLSRC